MPTLTHSAGPWWPDHKRVLAWSRIGVVIGAGLFIAALAVSAAVVPQLRVLHVLQGLIYLVVIALAYVESAWGLGAGVAIAVAWNSLSLFVTRLMQAGAVEWWSFLKTHHSNRVDTMMVFVGGVGHFVLILACVAAFLHLGPDKRKWGKFLGGGAIAIAYFVGIVALLAPR